MSLNININNPSNNSLTSKSSPLKSPQNGATGGTSFKEELAKTGAEILSNAKNTENSINQFTMGRISPEEIITSTKETALEFEGAIAVIKTSVESVKQILNIQI